MLATGHQLSSTLSKPILFGGTAAGNHFPTRLLLLVCQSTAPHFSSSLTESEDYKGSIKNWFSFSLISRVSQSP